MISFYDLYLLIVIILIKVASWLPYTLKQSLIKSIAGAAYWHSIGKRRQSEDNLRRVFGNSLTDSQVRDVVRASFLEFWQDVFAWLPGQAERASRANAELSGIEHLQQALAAGKGVILLEASFFGARGWSKQVLRERGVCVYQVHVERHLAGFASGPNTQVQHKYIKPILDSWEKPFVAEVVELPQSESLTYTRQLLSILGRNQVVCVSGEGHSGQKYINLPFLGQQRPFATGIVSLAKLSGAPLLPLFCMRDPNGKTRLIIESPLDLQMGTDREARIESGMAQYVAVLESYIRAYPSHYRNWHFRPDSS